MFAVLKKVPLNVLVTIMSCGLVTGVVISNVYIPTGSGERVSANPVCWVSFPFIHNLFEHNCDILVPQRGTIASLGTAQLEQMQAQVATLTEKIEGIFVEDELLPENGETSEGKRVSDTSPTTITYVQPTTTVLTTSVKEYLAGDGIKIESGVITNIDTGSSRGILKFITVDGQNTIEFADSNGALEVVAGSNITLSTNSTDRQLTISSTGGGTTFNNIFESGSNVGIGSSSPANKLDVAGNVALSANGRILLTANTPSTGAITRSITLTATSKYDRPWVSHIDYTGRHAASFGVHHTNYADDDVHKRWELKTSADPNGATPDVMLTRFAIDYDTDQANVIFGDVETVGTHNDYGQPATFVHNMQNSDGSLSINVGQWKSELGSSDSTVMSFDPLTLDSSRNVTLRFFRETTTSGQRRFVIMKGDGTTTETFTIDASTGLISGLADGETMRFGSGANTASYANFQSNRTMIGYDGSNAVIQGGTSKGIKFNVNSSSFGQGTVMTISSDAKVGIGTTSPVGKLHLDSKVTGKALTILNETGNQAILTASASGTTKFVIANNGNVGINTTSPSVALHVYSNTESVRLGDGTNTSSYINFQGNRTMIGYDGSSTILQSGVNKQLKLNVNSSSFGSGAAVIVDTDGDVGFGVSPTLGPIHAANGAYLSAGGSWENSSDRNIKQDFVELDHDLILEKINLLPVTQWSYIVDGSGVKHVGPVAQDFHAIFGLGASDKTVSSIDPAGIALVGIQGLTMRIAALDSKVNGVEEQTQQGALSDEWVQEQLEAAFEERGMVIDAGIWTFKLEAVFNELVRFAGRVVFGGVVEFLRPPIFNQDTAGAAIIKAGADRVEIRFDQPYPVPPQISVTPNVTVLSQDGAGQSQDETGQSAVDQTQTDQARRFFDQNLKYVVSQVSTEGFVITLSSPAQVDTGFSWLAIAVKNPRVAKGESSVAPALGEQSEGSNPQEAPLESSSEQSVEVQQESSPQVVATPAPTPSTPEASPSPASELLEATPASDPQS